MLSVPPPLRVVVYRRLMVRIAERLARGAGAHALVTGDSVGQVASQTVDNLAVVGSVATMPILRPLVGMGKEEITADAQRIGTYEISILPDEDCCTLFTPRYPSTRASASDVDPPEQSFNLSELVDDAMRAAVVEDFSFPVLESRALADERGDQSDAHPGKTGRHEGSIGRARRDCRRGDGSARVAPQSRWRKSAAQTSRTR